MDKIKCSFECPYQYMNYYGMGDYDYALVHLFEKNNNYFEYFKKSLKQNREVFLDNSIFELKSSFDMKKFALWIEKLLPTLYILPDVFNDSVETIENVKKFEKEYDFPFIKMGVIQGKTYNDMVECYKFMSDNVDYIGINHSSNLYQYIGVGITPEERQCSGRIKLITNLINDNIWNWEKPHHILGCSLTKEFNFYKNHNIYNIRSCDTSNPVMAGILNIKYNDTLGINFKPKGLMCDHINDDLNDTQIDLINYNIKCFRNIVN